MQSRTWNRCVASLATALSIVVTLPAHADDPPAIDPTATAFTYRDYRFDVSAIAGRADEPALLAAVREQVDIVEQVDLTPETRQFFRTYVVRLGVGRGGGHFDRQGVSVNLQPKPDDRPILLHEFMHAFHNARLPDGNRNADVRRFFERAHAPGLWPAQSYMLTNVGEFFAMTASTALYGHTDRPPFTREALEQKQPQYVQWLRQNVR